MAASWHLNLVATPAKTWQLTFRDQTDLMYYLQLFTVVLGILVLTTVSVFAQDNAKLNQPEASALVATDVESFVATLNLNDEQSAQNAELIEKREAQLAKIAAENPTDADRVSMLSREVNALYLSRLGKLLDQQQLDRLTNYRRSLQRN